MKFAIDYQEVDLSKEEIEYYKELVEQLSHNNVNGKEYFENLFKTDENGIITIIKPTNNIPWIVIHFIQQIQINQRLRSNDNDISKIKERLAKLENNINNWEKI